jgi:hypothetical protein
MKSLSVRLLGLVLTGAGCWAMTAAAQPVQHLSTTQPGGMPGTPVMENISKLTNGVQIIWDGPSGYYQVFQKSNSLTAAWLALGKATNLVRTATITQLYSNAFFRVSGPAPKYAGSRICISCHLNVCRFETNTAHAGAFSSVAFQASGGQTNASCLPCHTVGYGLPTGFVSATATPLLGGVQCENCHGPAGNHAASEDDPTVRPRAEIAATVCGGCHTASHTTFTTAPTFEEWSSSGHATVVPDALQVMAASTNNISSCGVCHSGSARLAFINGQNPAATLANDFNVPITCAVCHDPHATNANPAQLRGSVSSTNNFYLASADAASVGAFTNKYNASTNINLCAQCHNDRGAAWTDTARAPHHSLQYNFLLGSVGELPDGTATFNPGTHVGLPSDADFSISGTFYLTNQCAACHLPADAAVAGAHDHSLTVSYTVCANCHDGQAAQSSLTQNLSNTVSSVIFTLNRWAAIKAPAALRTSGVVPWEYTTPGGLTWQTNAAGNVTSWTLNESVNFTGPNAAGQALIATNILKARFNLYLVLDDGSFGVHNPIFALDLLNAAETWIDQELNK